MGHKKASIVLGLSILGFAGRVWARELGQSEPQTLRVLVMNQARVRPEVLGAAETDASAIFAATGVQLAWLDQASAGNERFDITIKIAVGMKPSMLPHTTVGDLSLGFAAVSPTSQCLRGRLAWIFFDQVETHAGNHHLQVSRLCGLVMAHEMGHLLLTGGHSERGLMRATWDLRAGLLEFFSDAQAEAIRTRFGYTRKQGC